MKNGVYESRKEQINAMVGELFADCEKAGCPLPKESRRLVRKFFKEVAMIAAGEERLRSLQVVNERHYGDAAVEIASQGVLTVLGY